MADKHEQTNTLLLSCIIMPVPWEALIPFGMFKVFHWTIGGITYVTDEPGLLTAMFGTAGTLFNVSTRAQNQGKVCSSYLT